MRLNSFSVMEIFFLNKIKARNFVGSNESRFNLLPVYFQLRLFAQSVQQTVQKHNASPRAESETVFSFYAKRCKRMSLAR